MPFYNAKHDIHNFAISFAPSPKDDFAIFALGYLNAASKLAEELLSSERFPDYDAYPIVFLYRHALELHLKNIIYKCTLLSALKRMNDFDEKLYNDHRLIPLSQMATAILKRLFPNDNDIGELIKRILRICAEFTELDPNSYSYRYPIDKTGGYSTKPHQVVNLECFHVQMSTLLGELEVIDFGLDVETNRAEEIYHILEELEQEFRSG